MAERKVKSTNLALAAEQERMAALVQRQHQLIACLGKVNDAAESSSGELRKAASKVREADAELISTFGRSIAKRGAADLQSKGEESILILAPLGAGTVSEALAI